MGLDTHAVVRGEDGNWSPAPDEPFEGLRLMGGVCSGGSDSFSIRGKVYDEVVDAATGESLYQKRIEPETVAKIARCLRAAVEEAKTAGTSIVKREYGLSKEHGLRIKLDDQGRPVESEEIPVLEVAGCEIDAEDAEHLARWFEVCAALGYALEGSW